MPHSFKLVIVDDHPIILKALSDLLGSDPVLQVVKALDNSRDLLAFLDSGPVDLILLDLNLGNADGIELIKSIRARDPELKILVFSMYEETEFAHRVISAGARGYIMKTHAADGFLEAVHTVLDGRIYMSDRVAMRGDLKGGSRWIQQLSDRELSVFGMLGRGMSTRATAEELHLSIKTVEKHRENIKSKLGITNMPKLVCEATKWVCAIEGGGGPHPHEGAPTPGPADTHRAADRSEVAAAVPDVVRKARKPARTKRRPAK